MVKKVVKINLGCLFGLTRRVQPYFYVLAGIVFLLVIFAVYLYFRQVPATVYIFPENPKQGDTVFIRVRSEADSITGSFGTEKISFYKKHNSPEWVAFVGIDVDQKPGEYKIFINVSRNGELVRKVEVAAAAFSSSPVVEAPIKSQSGITQDKAVSNIRNNDNPSLNKILSKLTPQPYFSGAFYLPLDPTKKIGFSFGEFVGFAKDKLQHMGVDLRANEGTKVHAVNDGRVVGTLNLSNYGKTVIIDHGLDIFSLYLHLSDFKVSSGQIVKRDQVIGLSGSTGYVTAPHLHFSMRVDQARVDPIAFIEATQKMDDNFVVADLSNAFLNLLNR